MTPTELAQDGAVVVHTLVVPARGLAEAVERRRVATALGVATLVSLLFAAVLVPRLDYEAIAARKQADGDAQAEVTAHARDEAVITARKLGHVSGWTGAAAGPSVAALLAAVALLAGFRVAGTQPRFKETFAAVVHGMMPVWLSPLLAIPAVLVRGVVSPEEVPRLLPSSLAALAPSVPPPLATALGAFDLFSLWALGLVALGMARATGASRLRAFTVTAVLFVAYVALLKIALPALMAGGPRGGP
jgi:hypothetical protein